MNDIDLQFKMEDIPITFEFEGKEIRACLSFTKGRAALVWDLHTVPERHGIAMKYWPLGELYLKEGYKWELWIKRKQYPELVDWFEAVLISWYQ